MKALIIINAVIKNQSNFTDYMKKATSTLGLFGGVPIYKGKFAGAIGNQINEHHVAATVTFPDLDSIDSWYNSEEYQALIPLRNEAAEITITKYSLI